MKFAIYHRDREFAREMGDLRLAKADAASKEEAERLTAHMGLTGTWAVRMTPGRTEAVEFIKGCLQRGHYDTDEALTAFCTPWGVAPDEFARAWNEAEDILIAEGLLHF